MDAKVQWKPPIQSGFSSFCVLFECKRFPYGDLASYIGQPFIRLLLHHQPDVGLLVLYKTPRATATVSRFCDGCKQTHQGNPKAGTQSHGP